MGIQEILVSQPEPDIELLAINPSIFLVGVVIVAVVGLLLNRVKKDGK